MDRGERLRAVFGLFEFDLGVAAMLYVSDNIDMICAKDVQRINEIVRKRGGDVILAKDVKAAFRQRIKTSSNRIKVA